MSVLRAVMAARPPGGVDAHLEVLKFKKAQRLLARPVGRVYEEIA